MWGKYTTAAQSRNRTIDIVETTNTIVVFFIRQEIILNILNLLTVTGNIPKN